ncbi:MAG: hypothetical protein JWQ96_964 [Segetibacter sp.]|nr:hypothetical protein [Segetibacter sp.]
MSLASLILYNFFWGPAEVFHSIIVVSLTCTCIFLWQLSAVINQSTKSIFGDIAILKLQPISHFPLRTLPIIVVLLFVTQVCFAQQVVKDTGRVEQRTFNEQKFKELKKDSDFDYQKMIEPPKSLWQRFWSWFWSQMRDIMRTKKGRVTLWAIFIVFGLAVILYFVFKVMKMNKAGLFGRRAGSGLDYDISTEDINQISFDEAIREAIEDRNYRLAVRLMYLKSLKLLADRGLIDWKENKTNTEYLSELSGKPFQPVFNTLTNHFEYTWYGEVAVEKGKFENMHQQFQEFYKQL